MGRDQIVDKRCTRCNTYKRLEEFDRKKENKIDAVSLGVKFVQAGIINMCGLTEKEIEIKLL